jgi:hypothetical protein
LRHGTSIASGYEDHRHIEAVAVSATTGPSFSRPSPGDFKPDTLEWRIAIARRAHDFFNPLFDRGTMTETIGRQHNPNCFEAWSVGDLLNYLPRAGFRGSDTRSVVMVLDAMARVGLLAPSGWDQRLNGHPWVGQLYISHAGKSPRGYQSSLWLAEVFGGELLIPAYNLVSVLITAGQGQGVGTGLVLDRTHIVTNRHVIKGLVGSGNVGDDLVIQP